MSEHFKTNFKPYVCVGDTITAEFGDFTLTARVYRDECGDKPDERGDGFWPSLDPKSAGYIGPKSRHTLARATARAQSVMDAWKNDEWFYCGIVVTVECEGVELVDEFAHALWGVDCNYPQHDKRRIPNAYLREVANELADDALASARKKLAALQKVA